MMLATLIHARASSSVTSTYSNSAQTEAAVLLGDHDAEEPHLAHLRHELVGHLALHRVELVGERQHLLHGELPGQVADRETVLGGVRGRERRWVRPAADPWRECRPQMIACQPASIVVRSASRRDHVDQRTTGGS